VGSKICWIFLVFFLIKLVVFLQLIPKQRLKILLLLLVSTKMESYEDDQKQQALEHKYDCLLFGKLFY
jgi:hypothetical protein